MRSWPVIIIAICVVACKNDLDRVAAIDVAADAPDRTTTHAEYFYSDSGKVRNRLRAGVINEYLTEGHEHTAMSDGVELTFYDAAGAAGSLLTARRGTILSKQHRMEVDEQVVFTNVRGEKLETEQLIWSQDSSRVWTSRPVKITRAQDIIYGQGLDANQDFTRYTVRNITGSLALNANDTTSAPKTAR